MTRKRVTQIFPFLTPLRQWQKRQEFYLKMKYDGRNYACTKQEQILPHSVYELSTNMINPDTGMDIQYQYNKVHNLKIAAKTMNHLIISPGQTFSFWQLARYAHLYGTYKEGLALVDGRLVPQKGGGLCQLSNALFASFLHTPLSIVERHPHLIDDFPSPDPDTPFGTDATINEGWQDLKVCNRTDATFQVVISFDETHMKISMYSDKPFLKNISVYNGKVTYRKKEDRIFQDAEVCSRQIELMTGTVTHQLLYVNHCQIGYPLDPSIHIEEESES